MIDRKEIDDYAAEYVLGTLDRKERIEVATMRATDGKMNDAITAWENRLAPLMEAVPEETPSPDVFVAIEKRIRTLSGKRQEPARPVSTISRWQALAIAASLAFVVVTGMKYLEAPVATPGQQYIAVLKDAKAPLFVVSLNQKNSTFFVRSLQPAPQDKSYELWLIADGEKAPRPVGVMSGDEANMGAITNLDPAIVKSATLAVSVEPVGGSPTGAPTGPVIVTGKFEIFSKNV